MKKQFSIIAACIALTLISCDKKEDTVVSAESSITSSGTISGQISNYSSVSTSLDSIYATEENTTAFLGKGKVGSDGKFSIDITTIPQLEENGTISGVTVSDPDAQIGAISLEAYKNKTQTGYYLRCDYTEITSESNNITTTYFLYADRPITLKGTYAFSETYNGVTAKISEVFDVKLKKGWNEISEKIALSYTNTSATSTTTYSSTIPTNLKWIYIDNNDIASVKKQIKSAFPIKHSSIFGQLLNRL